MRARLSSPRGKENNSSDEVECPGRARPKGRMPSPVRRTNEMMYSSISPPERRAASAKTISEQCFPGQSPSSAASPPPEYSPLDSVGDQVEVESYALDESEASPESRRIMAKMEQVYQSSPIPKDYLNTPPKKSPALPEIVLHPRSAAAKKSAGATAAKKGAASKSRPRRKDPRDATTTRATHGIPAASAIYGGGKGDARRPRRLSSAADAAGTDRRGSVAGGRGRETFSAPDVAAGGAAKSGGAATRAVVKPPAALAVQRERQQRESRQKGANAASSKTDGRRNLDKRTARLRFRDGFSADIARYRRRFPRLNDGSNHADKAGGQIQDRGANGVSIAVRKRPIFKYELDRGDYDVVSIDNVTGDSHDVCMVHNCGMHADMKQMLVKSTRYPVTAAFDEHACDDAVYRHIAEPLVLDAANGGVATILMFGQTGTGKSFTMSGIESRAAHGLFQAIGAVDSQPADRPGGERPAVTLQFVELCGSKEVRDLLVTGRGTDAPVKLADNDDGSVRLLNAVSLVIASPAELLEKIALAKGQRATEATDKNGVSSRSHAVCQVRIRGAGRGRGVLTLIDCAGSERKHDSMYHSRCVFFALALHCLFDPLPYVALRFAHGVDVPASGRRRPRRSMRPSGRSRNVSEPGRRSSIASPSGPAA